MLTFFAADGVLCMLVLGWVMLRFGQSNADALKTVERARAMQRADDARDRKAAQKEADAEAKRELAERWEAEQRASVPEPFRVPAIPHAPVTPAKVEPAPVAKVRKPAKRTATITPPTPERAPEPTPEPERVIVPAKVPATPPVRKREVAPTPVPLAIDPALVTRYEGCTDADAEKLARYMSECAARRKEAAA